MIYFGSSYHKKKKIGEKNGGRNQDGRREWIFHSAVNFYSNQLKLGI
jgi:hypothetical protein